MEGYWANVVAAYAQGLLPLLANASQRQRPLHGRGPEDDLCPRYDDDGVGRVDDCDEREVAPRETERRHRRGQK